MSIIQIYLSKEQEHFLTQIAVEEGHTYKIEKDIVVGDRQAWVKALIQDKIREWRKK